MAGILPSFSTGSGAGYDSYEVTKSLGNVNHYWLVAIGSVRYKQDLNIMDGPMIEQLLFDKLTYTTSIRNRILSIVVRDLTPDAFMDKLGFTQEEKGAWKSAEKVLAPEPAQGRFRRTQEHGKGAGHE